MSSKGIDENCDADIDLFASFNKDIVLAQSVVSIGSYWYRRGYIKGFEVGGETHDNSSWFNAILLILIGMVVGVILSMFIVI